MNKSELREIKKSLLERRTEILSNLLDEHETYVEHLRTDTGDLADEAYDVIERELAYDLSVTEKAELEEINEALSKIDDGSYGICELCKIKIPLQRLKVKPYAKYCIKCQEKQERKKIFNSEEAEEETAEHS
ncbi:MAG: TraR/DksA C4-type zinc finger protein [Spirochaetes bacterium]|nr:TraR/DksA C4-type zinc finger protein [Spirochaetota bacterium]